MQRNLIPQPLSFFNTSGKKAGAGGTTAGSLQSSLNPASVVEGTGKVLKAAESIKQRQQQGALGKTASSLNVQNLTVVQQIQLLALIQQYQTMQKPKPVAASQASTASQLPEDKTLTSDHRHSTNETLNKSSPVPVINSDPSTDKEPDTELYKLMHAAPIKTTPPKKLGRPSQPLVDEEVSSDTVNNLLSSLMNNQSDKHQQDLARLADETADLLPSFTAGLLQSKSNNSVGAAAGVSAASTDALPELLLNSDTPQKPDYLPSLDSDTNPLGMFNFDSLLEVLIHIENVGRISDYLKFVHMNCYIFYTHVYHFIVSVLCDWACKSQPCDLHLVRFSWIPSVLKGVFAFCKLQKALH